MLEEETQWHALALAIIHKSISPEKGSRSVALTVKRCTLRAAYRTAHRLMIPYRRVGQFNFNMAFRHPLADLLHLNIDDALQVLARIQRIAKRSKLSANTKEIVARGIESQSHPDICDQPTAILAMLSPHRRISGRNK